MTDHFCDTSKLRSHIRQSRSRIGSSTRLIAVSRSAIDRSREAIRSSNVYLAKPAGELDRDVGVASILTFLMDHDDATMGAVVEEFSFAYQKAVATGDDVGVDVFRRALLILGRHLAADLGPKAGGVSIN